MDEIASVALIFIIIPLQERPEIQCKFTVLGAMVFIAEYIMFVIVSLCMMKLNDTKWENLWFNSIFTQLISLQANFEWQMMVIGALELDLETISIDAHEYESKQFILQPVVLWHVIIDERHDPLWLQP